MGILKNKTRILCTHHWKYLHDADVIVVMERGKVACIGFPNEVLKKDTWIKKMSASGRYSASSVQVLRVLGFDIEMKVVFRGKSSYWANCAIV